MYSVRTNAEAVDDYQNAKGKTLSSSLETIGKKANFMETYSITNHS